jgi:hypothetical protein
MSCLWKIFALGVAMLCGLAACQPIRQAPVPELVCQATETGQTLQSLIDSARGQTLRLNRVISGTVLLPAFNSEQRFVFSNTGAASSSDGCNRCDYFQDATFDPAKQPFFQNYTCQSTMLYCPGATEYHMALWGVTHYQKCGEEYWLYYNSVLDNSPAGVLIFTASPMQ